MPPTDDPPTTQQIAAAALIGGGLGLAAGYYLAVETDDLTPDTVLYYDAEVDPVWSYE